MMATLPLFHVAREKIRGGAVPLVATAMVAGGVFGARKTSQLGKWL